MAITQEEFDALSQRVKTLETITSSLPSAYAPKIGWNQLDTLRKSEIDELQLRIIQLETEVEALRTRIILLEG